MYVCLNAEGWLPGSERLIQGINIQGETTPQCMVCEERKAVGIIRQAPDGVELFGNNYACERCCKQPAGWPGPEHRNLKSGSCKGCLGHTVFAVALDKELTNFGAFTTENIPVSASGRHEGIFFDGEIRSGHECLHGSHRILVGSRASPTHSRVYVDGFDLIRDYKQVQTDLLGVLSHNPEKPEEGTWTRFFQLRGGKSIIFHLPRHLRFRGSAHLSNAADFSNYNLKIVSQDASLLYSLRSPYLVRSTGATRLANKGMQLTWIYDPDYDMTPVSKDRDRQVVIAPNLPKLPW